jgi:hypothetical protein
MTYVSDGSTWSGWANAEGTGSGGSTIFTSDANGYYTASKIGLGGSNSSTSTWTRMGASTTSVSSFRVPSGPHPTSPADGDEWRVAKARYFAYNGTTYQILAVPDNGLAGQVVTRNAANDDYEHRYGHTALGKYRKVSNTNLTVVDSDYAVFIGNQTAARTLNLPNPVSYPDRVLIIGQTTGNGSQVNLSINIYDASDNATNTILNNNKYMIMSDGTVWRILMERL